MHQFNDALSPTDGEFDLRDTPISSNLNIDFSSGPVEQEVMVAIDGVNQTHQSSIFLCCYS